MPSWDDVDPAAIAFLFVACARTADGELVESEVVRAVERIAAWMPGASREQVREVLARAVELHRSAPDERSVIELVRATAERLRTRLAQVERERVVTEIIGLVRADGEVDLGELDFVVAVAKILEVEVAVVDEA